MSIEPAEAVDMYLTDRTSELSENSIKSYRKRLNAFIRWCNDNEITHLSNIEGIDLHRFKVDQQEQVAHATMVNRLHALRALLQWAGRIDVVDAALHEKVVVPKDDSSRSRAIDSDTASAILSYLRRFEYASRNHVVMELLWTTAMRLGEIRSIDLDDFHPAPDDAKGPYITLRHRPDTGTPLKNGPDGERTVSIRPETRSIVDDYIAHNRAEVTDEYERDPLVTVVQARRRFVTRSMRGPVPVRLERTAPMNGTQMTVKQLQKLSKRSGVRMCIGHTIFVEEESLIIFRMMCQNQWFQIDVMFLQMYWISTMTSGPT